jgi:eukaryotic-like serine/threonine-protein kinase
MVDDLVAGRYRRLRRLGQGGMGSVWLALDEALDRQVALKEVSFPRGFTDRELAELRARARREARAAAALKHPGIVTIYDILEEDDDPWIVMEYIEGPSLAELIAQAPDGLAEAFIASIGLSVLGALRVAHRAGVIHRDIKPANILIDRPGQEVFLADFGIAKVEGQTTITQSGAVPGTREFMAPEWFRDGPDTVGRPVDLWSLGVTLYYAAQGRSPFRRGHEAATIHAVLQHDPEPLTRAQGLERVIRRLLDKTPATRIGVEEAMDLLHRISPPGEPVPSGPGYQKPAHPRPRSSFAVIAAQGPAKAAELLRKMGPRTAGEVLDNMAGEVSAATAVVGAMAGGHAAEILNCVQPETAATILLALDATPGARILAGMGVKPATAALETMSARDGGATAMTLRELPVPAAGNILNQANAKLASRLLLHLAVRDIARIMAEMAPRPAGAVLGAMGGQAAVAAAVAAALPVELAAAILEAGEDATELLGRMDQQASIQVIRHLNGRSQA